MQNRSCDSKRVICFAHPNDPLSTGPGGDLVAKLLRNAPDVLVHETDLNRAADTRFPSCCGDLYHV